MHRNSASWRLFPDAARCDQLAEPFSTPFLRFAGDRGPSNFRFCWFNSWARAVIVMAPSFVCWCPAFAASGRSFFCRCSMLHPALRVYAVLRLPPGDRPGQVLRYEFCQPFAVRITIVNLLLGAPSDSVCDALISSLIIAVSTSFRHG